MRVEELPEIVFRNPYNAANPMRHEHAGLDPPADRAGAYPKPLSHVGDREEQDAFIRAASGHFGGRTPACVRVGGRDPAMLRVSERSRACAGRHARSRAF